MNIDEMVALAKERLGIPDRGYLDIRLDDASIMPSELAALMGIPERERLEARLDELAAALELAARQALSTAFSLVRFPAETQVDMVTDRCNEWIDEARAALEACAPGSAK